MNNFFASSINRTLVALALAAVALAFFSYAFVTLKNSSGWVGPVTINVIGTGEVQAVPDVATFSFTAFGEGEDAAAAQSNAAETVNGIIAYLKEAEVAEADIKTTSYTVNPQYSYEQRPCAIGMYCPPTDPVQTGFEAYQMVTVKVRKTDTAGALLGGVGERGARDISGLSFMIDDEEALKDEARAAAIADAQAQAKDLAKQLGGRLGKMTGYYEETPYMPSPYYGMGGDMMMSAKAESMTPEVPMGENTITFTVNLSYEIK